MIKKRLKNIIDKYGKTHLIIFAIFLAVLFVVALFDKKSPLKIMGVYNLALSLYSLYRFRNDKKMAMLVGILSIINISYASCVCYNAASNARTWQIGLVEHAANYINIYNYSLFITVFLNCLIPNNDESRQKFEFQFIKGSVLFYIFYAILVSILIFGVTASTETVGYVNNQNPLFEYAIVLYAITWIFASKEPQKWMLYGFALFYVGRGLLIGDRSSAFPMILLNLMLICNGKIKIKYVIILGLAGIIFGNIIDIYRNDIDVFSKDTFNNIVSRGINVNTISYSSYAGTQIIRAKGNSNHYDHMLNYTKSLFLGKTNKYVVNYAADAKGYVQKGGGLTSTYFYYWGGYFLTVIGGLLFAFICNFFFKQKNNISTIFQLLITIFSMRWFLYFPSAFFRTAIIIPFALFVFAIAANNMINHNSKLFKGVW